MKWKELFEPSWRKFFVFLIIYYLSIISNGILNFSLGSYNINLFNVLFLGIVNILMFVNGLQIGIMGGVVLSLYYLLNIVYQYA